jgi:CBS domain-containing protein
MTGVITESDIIRQVAERQECPEKAPVAEVMTGDVVHCHPNDLLDDV